jgi:hypothetical protein
LSVGTDLVVKHEVTGILDIGVNYLDRTAANKGGARQNNHYNLPLSSAEDPFCVLSLYFYYFTLAQIFIYLDEFKII